MHVKMGNPVIQKFKHHWCIIVRFPIRLGFPLITFPSGVFMKSIGASVYNRMQFLASTTGDAVNSYKNNILVGTLTNTGAQISELNSYKK